MIACGLAPELGIIAMDFNSPQEVQEYIDKKGYTITHWTLQGVLEMEITTLYEKKNGVVLIDRFSEYLKKHKKDG